MMQALPAVRYVALGWYESGIQYRYAEVVVNNTTLPHISASWGTRRLCFWGNCRVPTGSGVHGARAIVGILWKTK